MRVELVVFVYVIKFPEVGGCVKKNDGKVFNEIFKKWVIRATGISGR